MEENDAAMIARFEEFCRRHSATMAEFLADPQRYLAVAAQREGTFHITDEDGEALFAIQAAADFFDAYDRYLDAGKKAGLFDAEMLRIIESGDEILKARGADHSRATTSTTLTKGSPSGPTS